MKYHKQTEAILMLADGTIYRGKSVGAIGTTTGEIAFNTGMTGYQEIFTDPSYYGQILAMTVAHIGNYGIQTEETESGKIQIAGLICKKFSEFYSRPAASQSLQQYFKNHGTVGISDIDTRALVRHIRTVGAMNAVISSSVFDTDVLTKELNNTPDMSGLMLSDKVSTNKIYQTGDSSSQYRVAVIDYGVKHNILRCLIERGCALSVFPYDATSEEILQWNPDGIMLSNGPGDPSVMHQQVETVRQIVNTGLPVFGICLGHQILALSQRMSTKKMHHGHRGINHPILNLETGKCEITSQNHGFVVDDVQKPDNESVIVTHKHLNDNTLAGLSIVGANAFSVQYHPESSAGPNDSRYLFDRFIEKIKVYKSFSI